MTTYLTLTDYLEKTLKAKRPTEFKKLLKIQTELVQYEIDLEHAKRIITERNNLISDLSNELNRLKDLNNKLIVDISKEKDNALELRKQNDNLKQQNEELKQGL